MNFSDGIRSMLRQDPDILFIGEVRDSETAQMALRAAMTGHQVYTTLHTNDAISVVARLTDIGVPKHLLSGQIICCIAQRLVRQLCLSCRISRVATEGECELLGVESDPPPTIYDPAGCEACEYQGYRGRTAISEILPIDDSLDDLIAQGATRASLLAAASEAGFRTMADDGRDKVLSGITSLEALMRSVDVTAGR